MSGIIISMTEEGAKSTLGKLRKVVKYAKKDSMEVTTEYAKKLQETVRKNASGRPGPNVISGAYRDSIEFFVEDEMTAGARTGAPQANRLEFGFTGSDSLGRYYNQPAFPHWQPARDEIGPQYLAAMRARATRWWA